MRTVLDVARGEPIPFSTHTMSGEHNRRFGEDVASLCGTGEHTPVPPAEHWQIYIVIPYCAIPIL